MKDVLRSDAKKDATARRSKAAAESSEVVAVAVRRFQAGKEREASFRILFEHHHAAVEGFFARRCSSLEESLDLTQETFLRVYKGLDGYQWQAPFGAWLFRIAWNVLRSQASRPGWRWGQQMELEDAALVAGGGSCREEPRAASSLLSRERRQRLRSAIEKLPDQRRRCMVLWAYHELTYRQIAAALRISIGTVKAHMSQARQQLEGLLAEENEVSGHG